MANEENGNTQFLSNVDPQKMPNQQETKALMERFRARGRFNPHPNEAQDDHMIANALEAYGSYVFGWDNPTPDAD